MKYFLILVYYLSTIKMILLSKSFLKFNKNPLIDNDPLFNFNVNKIDYEAINYGLMKSFELSKKLNYINNNRCKCYDQAIFCECEDFVMKDDLSESIPIIMPLIKPILEKRKQFNKIPNIVKKQSVQNSLNLK